MWPLRVRRDQDVCLRTSSGSRRPFSSTFVDGGTPPDRASLLRAIHRDGTNAGGQSKLALASPWVPLSVRDAFDSAPGLTRLASVNVAAPYLLADTLAATGAMRGGGFVQTEAAPRTRAFREDAQGLGLSRATASTVCARRLRRVTSRLPMT